MSVSRRDALFAARATLPAAGLFLAAARAQTPPTGAAPAVPAGEDPLLAACLAISGREQIENCTFALTKLQSDDVKAFARAEIAEHQKIAADLQKLGYGYPVAPAAPSQAAPVGLADRPAWAVTSGPVRLPAEAASLIAVDHEVADRCVLNYRKEMERYAGVRFDKRFVGHQLDTHFDLLDHAQVFRRHASAAMAPTLDQGLTIIERHIATLRDLMERLDGGQVRPGTSGEASGNRTGSVPGSDGTREGNRQTPNPTGKP